MGIDGAMIDQNKNLFLKGSAFGVYTLGQFLGIFPWRLRYLSIETFSCQKCDYEINSCAPCSLFQNKIDIK